MACSKIGTLKPTGRKNGFSMMFEGFKFTKNGTCKNHILWKCSLESCPAKAKSDHTVDNNATVNNVRFYNENGGHESHLPNPERTAKEKFAREVIKQALAQPDATSGQVASA